MRLILGALALIASGAGAAAGAGGVSRPAPVDDPRWAVLAHRLDETKAAMMGDPARALRFADAALALARSLPQADRRAGVAVATAEWLDGEALLRLSEPERAAPMIAHALSVVTHDAPDSKLHGDLLRSRGALAAGNGHVQEALRSYQQAYHIFARARVPRSQAIALEDIGQIYSDAGDYDRAERYYAQSMEAYHREPALVVTANDERGEVLRRMGKLRESAAAFRVAARYARLLHSDALEVQVLGNLASVQAALHDTAAAQASVNRALALSAHPEAQRWRPLVLATAGLVARDAGDLPRAAQLFDQAFAGVDLSATEIGYVDLHKAASETYEALGRPDRALAHLRAFQRLNDGARALTASNSSQLLSARFDFTNQNLKISALKQGQLQADIRLEKQRSVLLAVALGAGGVVLLLLASGFVSIRRSRNQVRAANITLTGVNAQLAKALKAKTEFLAMTSHEIRTPLNGILGMTQVMLAGRALPPDERGRVEVIHGAGEAMKALVDDILDVAKMEGGDVAVNREPVPLRRLLDELRRLWAGHAGAKGVALVLECDGVPDRVVGDEARLRQVLSNLLSNAVKFTERGEIRLSAAVQPADAGEADGGAGERLCIAVQDSGIGIPAEQQALVFDAFHQVDAGMTRQFSGTGLGLAICRKLAVAMGGTIDLASTPGAGSTFTVRLPLERVAADAAPASPAPADGPAPRPSRLADATLLLVERNLLAQGVVRALLEPHVGRIEAVADGEAALDAMARGGISHVLIEGASADLPETTRRDSVRALLAEADARAIRTTLLLAPSEALPVAEAAMLGAGQLVLKPIGGAGLIAALRAGYEDDDAAHAPAPAPAAVAAASSNR